MSSLSKKYQTDNFYTAAVKGLLETVYPASDDTPSLYNDARIYFRHTSKLVNQIKVLQDELRDPKQKRRHNEVRNALRKAKDTLESERLLRVKRLQKVVNRVIEMCEGETYAETQLHTSKFLATLFLIDESKAKHFAQFHKRVKPLYKSALILRLMDKVITDNALAEPEIMEFSNCLNRFENSQLWQKRWQQEVATPLITCALIQDIGLQHPDAELIIKGEQNTLDEFRLLEEEDRKRILKLNYQHTMDYLKYGLGALPYDGNDPLEADDFAAVQERNQVLMTSLIKDAFVPKTHIGELLKIPQIYASVIFSTKSDYSHKELPKGYMLVEQLAKKGNLNADVAKCFIDIVGYFPLGFGVCFIPTNEQGTLYSHFDYAIVNHINPKHPAEPNCRAVSRNTKFVANSYNKILPRTHNLYFAANHTKLSTIDKARIKEIASELSGTYVGDRMEQVIPSYWDPHDYFIQKEHQNLWKK